MEKSRTFPWRLLPVITCLAIASAQAAQDAGLPGAYLNYAGSARSIGMSRALVGLAEGSDAVAWNPAGLAFLRPNVISFVHSQTGENANVESFGYAQPIYRWGGIGMHYIRLDSGSLPLTNEFNQEIGRYRDVQQTVMAGYGYAPLRWLAAGSTFKFSQQSLSGASANGWGLDVGVLAMMRHGLSCGLRLENVIAPSFRYATGEDQFARLMTIGLAARLLNNRLILTSDAEKALNAAQTLKLRMGIEGVLLRAVVLRGGFDFANKAFTLGFSYRFGRQEIAYANGMNQLGSSNHVGLDYSFGGYEVAIHAKPESFSPVGLKKTTTISTQVNHNRRIYTWNFEIRDQSRNLVRSIRGSGNPPAEFEWTGTNEDGIMVGAGAYTYTLTLTDVDNRAETTPAQIIHLYYGTPQDAIEVQSH